MTMVSIAILYLGMRESAIIYKVIGLIASVFFGSCTIYNFLRTIKAKPLLTITLDGIIDSSSASAYGFISFLEIEHIEEVNIFGQQVIGITLKDFEAFSKKLTPVKIKSARASMRMNLPPVAIRVDTAKDISLKDIVTLLQKRLADYSSLY